MAVATRQLCVDGPRVSALGLGCMGMGKSSAYGGNDPAEGIRTIHAAVAAGVTLLDTGDFYGMGQNELRTVRPSAASVEMTYRSSWGDVSIYWIKSD